MEGGYSVTHESSDVAWSNTCLENAASCAAVVNPIGGNAWNDSRFRRGPAAGGGLEFKFGKVAIAPEIRYYRLNNPNTNQATALVGFTF